MRPPEVTLDLGTPPDSPPSTTSDFEEVPYPPNHWKHHQRQEEELPLHSGYMTEEKARRRVPTGKGFLGGEMAYSEGDKGAALSYDDESKDVYAKFKATRPRIGSGRVQRGPPPPATSIVRIFCRSPRQRA